MTCAYGEIDYRSFPSRSAQVAPTWDRVSSRVVHFRSEQVRTTHPRPGERHLLTAPAPSRAIRGVLNKFADLPQEAEEEIRGLDQARRRIAELERSLKGASGAQQIDQVAIDRAVTSAVERERVEWQRKLEQGRAQVPTRAPRLEL